MQGGRQGTSLGCARSTGLPRIGNSKSECWAGHSLGLRFIFGDVVDAEDGHEQDVNEDYFAHSFFVRDASCHSL